MSILKPTITLLVCFLLLSCNQDKNTNYLEESWTKQVQPLQTKYLALNFKENVHGLGHLNEPW